MAGILSPAANFTVIPLTGARYPIGKVVRLRHYPTVSLKPYRRVLAVPGVRTLLLVGILARVPATALGITLTLHVTKAMGLSWAQAGLVTAAYTIGAAVGQPLTGRLLDRRGLRLTMLLTTLVQIVVWTLAPHLSYGALLFASVIGGLFGPPIFSVVRLSLAAMVPADQRRPAFALDSMIVELSYMVGPALAVVLATTLPPGYGLYALAAGLVVSGALVWWLNPPTQPEGQEIPEVAPSRRTWLSPRLVALMVAGAAATLVLSASEITLVATMQETGVQHLTGLAIALWCVYSLAGGLVFGMVRRPVTALTLVGALALLTIPVGLAPWPWIMLALLPSGLLCAPSMTAANDNLTRIVPPAARGEANGLLSSAFTAGVAAGAPFAGMIIDGWGPAWSFAAAGVAGVLVVLVAVPAYRLGTRVVDAESASDNDATTNRADPHVADKAAELGSDERVPETAGARTRQS
jgi:MFS family permease